MLSGLDSTVWLVLQQPIFLYYTEAVINPSQHSKLTYCSVVNLETLSITQTMVSNDWMVVKNGCGLFPKIPCKSMVLMMSTEVDTADSKV